MALNLVLPRSAAPPGAPTRPARGMSGFWLRQVVFDAFEDTREGCALREETCRRPSLPGSPCPAAPLCAARPDPPGVCSGFGFDRSIFVAEDRRRGIRSSYPKIEDGVFRSSYPRKPSFFEEPLFFEGPSFFEETSSSNNPLLRRTSLLRRIFLLRRTPLLLRRPPPAFFENDQLHLLFVEEPFFFEKLPPFFEEPLSSKTPRSSKNLFFGEPPFFEDPPFFEEPPPSLLRRPLVFEESKFPNCERLRSLPSRSRSFSAHARPRHSTYRRRAGPARGEP